MNIDDETNKKKKKEKNNDIKSNSKSENKRP